MRRRVRLAPPAFLALLALLVAVHQPLPAQASAPPSPASGPLPAIAPSGPASQSAPAAPPAPVSRPDAVARVVMSLLSYARWPGERETVRLCIDSSARYAGKLMEGGTLSTGRLVEARRVDTLPESLAAECDALYLGAMNDARRRALTAYFIGKPVLVMTEEDFECEGGSMFCLSIREHQVSFRINLDAIARSGIHVHPGVLQLGRRKAPAS
ncbi:YfiR family protein [Cupriavidus sp. D384]|uniref:YfiR family protein n=1 Tax=Cupriavidus sp. D384 TaxID=1538095 RepID=UPI000B2BCA90